MSSNDLFVLPPAVGWLPLKSLESSRNARLRIPPVVLDGGFRAVMSYLMVVCEQHRLVEQHLDKFAVPNEEMGCPQVVPITRAEDVPTDPGELAALIDARMEAAAISGIADLRYLGACVRASMPCAHVHLQKHVPDAACAHRHPNSLN